MPLTRLPRSAAALLLAACTAREAPPNDTVGAAPAVPAVPVDTVNPFPGDTTAAGPPDSLRAAPGAAPGADTLAGACGPAPAAGAPAAVVTVPVNRGTHGMAARVRWALSPDRCALLVTEDPAAVEAEPVPNGFVFATERGPALVRQDSVWDVAPSPDWRRVAFGRAYGHLQGERDVITDQDWESLARKVGLPVDTVRKGAFPSSDMAIAYAASRPFVLEARPDARPQALDMLGGWRIGWTRDGALAVGGNPKGAQDFWPAVGWVRVDLATPAITGTLDSADVVPVRWQEGPALDISTPVDLAPPRTFRLGEGTGTRAVVSRDGVVRLVTGTDSGRVIGPGAVLAATRNGRYVAAIVPARGRKEYDPPNAVVVYDVRGPRE